MTILAIFVDCLAVSTFHTMQSISFPSNRLATKTSALPPYLSKATEESLRVCKEQQAVRRSFPQLIDCSGDEMGIPVAKTRRFVAILVIQCNTGHCQ